MTRCSFPGLRADRRGVAALEFALIMPVLLAIIAGLADFGLAYFDKSKLAVAVSAGAQYAFSQGQLNQTATANGVREKVQSALDLPGNTVIVSEPEVACVVQDPTATPSATLQDQKPGENCPGTTEPPGTYITITARYAYVPLMPLYSHLASTTLQETAVVRLF